MGFLSSLTIDTRDVEVSEGEQFTVRGFSATDIATLCETHMPAITTLTGAAMALENGGKTDINAVIQLALKTAPELVSHIIVMANDDPNVEEAVNSASKLPVTTQLHALIDIFELTLKSEAEVKKIMGMLAGQMESLTNVVQSAQNSGLPTGGLESDAT